MQPTQPTDAKAATTNGRPFLLIAVLGTLAFLTVSFAPQVTVEKYRVSYLSLVPILWAVLFLRRVFAVHPLHYALFVLALLFHDLGAFGGYSWMLGGLQFDWCVHGFFGLVGGLMFGRWLNQRVGVSGGKLFLLVVLSVGGVSSVHEIMEAGTSMFLGDYGMAYYGPDNPWDAQEDMLSGLVGALIAATWTVIGARSHRSSSA